MNALDRNIAKQQFGCTQRIVIAVIEKAVQRFYIGIVVTLNSKHIGAVGRESDTLACVAVVVILHNQSRVGKVIQAAHRTGQMPGTEEETHAVALNISGIGRIIECYAVIERRRGEQPHTRAIP